MPRPRDTGAEERILDAAVRRISRGDPWTLRELAEDAGVSRASLYRRFRSREVLLSRLAQERGVVVEADEGTRARVLDAVGSLLKSGGLAAMTIDEVARCAGVGTITVYRRFGDRKGLLRAFAVERSPRRVASQLKLAGGEEIEADLMILARTALRFIAEHRALVLLALSPDREARELLGHIRDMPGTTREALLEFLRRHVRAGRIVGDPERMVQVFVGGVLGLGILHQGEASEDTLEANARFAVCTFLRGVEAPQGEAGRDVERDAERQGR